MASTSRPGRKTLHQVNTQISAPGQFPRTLPFACRGGAHPQHTNADDCGVCRAYLEWDTEVQVPMATQTWIHEHKNEIFAAALQNAQNLICFDIDYANRSIEESFDTLCDYSQAFTDVNGPPLPERGDVDPQAVRVAYLEEILHVLLRHAVRRDYASVTCERWLDGSEYDISAFDLESGKLAPRLAFALEHAEEYDLTASDILMDASEKTDLIVMPDRIGNG